jgi:hypothetical protein
LLHTERRLPPPAPADPDDGGAEAGPPVARETALAPEGGPDIELGNRCIDPGFACRPSH